MGHFAFSFETPVHSEYALAISIQHNVDFQQIYLSMRL